MERVVYVEVLGRRGEVAQRVRLAQLPATIGRAWTNDVILADPLVDPQHARLDVDEQGGLVLVDLGSVNGLYRDGSAQRTDRLSLAGLATVRLGRTQLRVASADQPVPPALRDAVPTGPVARLLAAPGRMAAVIVLGALLATLSQWLSDTRGQTARELANDVVEVVVAVALWAALWSLAGRFLVQRARYWAHLTIAWLVVIALGTVDLVESYLTFLFPASGVTAVVTVVTAVALLVWLIVTHAGLATAASRRRRLAFGAAVTAAFALLAWLGDKASHGDSDGTVIVAAQLKPVPVPLIPTSTVADFLRRTDALKQAVDELED